jgi:hypothetical protein
MDMSLISDAMKLSWNLFYPELLLVAFFFSQTKRFILLLLLFPALLHPTASYAFPLHENSREPADHERKDFVQASSEGTTKLLQGEKYACWHKIEIVLLRFSYSDSHMF